MNPLGAVRGLGGVALLVALWASGGRKGKQHPEEHVPDGRNGGQPGGAGGEERRARKRPTGLGLTEEDLGLLAPYVVQGLIVGKVVVGLHEDAFLSRGWQSRPGAPEHLTPDNACVKWRTHVEAWFQAPTEGAMVLPRPGIFGSLIPTEDHLVLPETIHVFRVLSEAAEAEEDRTLRVGRRYRLWLALDQLGRRGHFALVASRRIERSGK